LVHCAAPFCYSGAARGESPADIAAKHKLIVTMLPSSLNVAAVYTGENGILQFSYTVIWFDSVNISNS